MPAGRIASRPAVTEQLSLPAPEAPCWLRVDTNPCPFPARRRDPRGASPARCTLTSQAENGRHLGGAARRRRVCGRGRPAGASRLETGWSGCSSWTAATPRWPASCVSSRALPLPQTTVTSGHWHGPHGQARRVRSGIRVSSGPRRLRRRFDLRTACSLTGALTFRQCCFPFGFACGSYIAAVRPCVHASKHL